MVTIEFTCFSRVKKSYHWNLGRYKEGTTALVRCMGLEIRIPCSCANQYHIYGDKRVDRGVHEMRTHPFRIWLIIQLVFYVITKNNNIKK